MLVTVPQTPAAQTNVGLPPTLLFFIAYVGFVSLLFCAAMCWDAPVIHGHNSQQGWRVTQEVMQISPLHDLQASRSLSCKCSFERQHPSTACSVLTSSHGFPALSLGQPVSAFLRSAQALDSMPRAARSLRVHLWLAPQDSHRPPRMASGCCVLRQVSPR